MIIKKEFKTNNMVKYEMIDGIDKIDSGTFDNGVDFVNVYKSNRKKDDDFETIEIKSIILYIMNNDGKTIQIFR